jgi:hypothetical protein
MKPTSKFFFLGKETKAQLVNHIREVDTGLKAFLKNEFLKQEHSSAEEMHSPYKFNDENISAGKHF